MKVGKRFRSEKGAATIVEASIVMPIVFMVVCFLFIMGYYQLEITTLQSRADRVADVASRIIAQAGYEKYGNIETNKIDFEEKPSMNATTLKEIYKDLAPYRYWGSGSRALGDSASNKLTNVMSAKAYFDSKASITSVQIKPKKAGLSNKVEVIVNSKVDLPEFFPFLGLPTHVDKTFTTVAFVSDSSEFLRNTDIVFDLTEFLAEKCKLTDDVRDIVNKMKKQFKFINAE